MKVTIKRVMGFGPCEGWTEERMLKISGGKRSMDALDILCSRKISVEDRIWLGVHLLPKSDAREFARWCALQVIDKWKAPEVVVRWLKTGDKSLLSAASAVAWSTTSYAASAVAWSTTSYATSSATSNAAFSVARYASSAFALGTQNAAKLKQLAKIREMIR